MKRVRFSRPAARLPHSYGTLRPPLRTPILLRTDTTHSPSKPPSLVRHASDSNLPRITQPSVWRSMIPKPFRSPEHPNTTTSSSTTNTSGTKPPKKPWNPATFFIIIFMLIGSQAIQSVALHSDFAAFSRQTEARLELLREVVRRLKAGEEVDVEGMLGTGEKRAEREWEEVLRELEDEDALFSLRAERRRKKRGRGAKKGGEGEGVGDQQEEEAEQAKA